tara:strand:+ start:891 stop:1754 length:864 start_codon:yes stop_codon:yes gene_type:complete
MAKIFPDGSTVTRVFPDPPVAADTSKWEVLYTADIGDVSEDSATLESGDPVVIAGKSWTVRNGAESSGGYCSDFKIVSGSGLNITIASSDPDSEQDGSTTTVPLIEILVSTLIGETPASDDTLAFQVLMESTGMNDNWQTQGITIIDAANKWVANRTLYNAGGYTSGPVGNDVMKGDTQRLANLNNYGTGSAEPGLRETVWHVGSASFICSSNITKSFIDPLNCTSMEVCTTVDSALGVTNITEDPTLAITPGGARVQLIAGHEHNDDGSTWTAKYTHFRVLRRKKS